MQDMKGSKPYNRVSILSAIIHILRENCIPIRNKRAGEWETSLSKQ